MQTVRKEDVKRAFEAACETASLLQTLLEDDGCEDANKAYEIKALQDARRAVRIQESLLRPVRVKQAVGD